MYDLVVATSGLPVLIIWEWLPVWLLKEKEQYLLDLKNALPKS